MFSANRKKAGESSHLPKNLHFLSKKPVFRSLLVLLIYLRQIESCEEWCVCICRCHTFIRMRQKPLGLFRCNYSDRWLSNMHPIVSLCVSQYIFLRLFIHAQPQCTWRRWIVCLAVRLPADFPKQCSTINCAQSKAIISIPLSLATWFVTVCRECSSVQWKMLVCFQSGDFADRLILVHNWQDTLLSQ